MKLRTLSADATGLLVVVGCAVWVASVGLLALQLRDEAKPPLPPVEQAELNRLYGVMVHDSLSILNAVRGVSRELDHLCIELSGMPCLEEK